MSYRAGIGTDLAAISGLEPGGPRITCDGCGVTLNIRQDRLPPAWFLDGRAAPGWALTRQGETRDDRCPKCRPAPARKKRPKVIDVVRASAAPALETYLADRKYTPERQGPRSSSSGPQVRMNVHEERAWRILIELGARELELGGKHGLDLSPIRVTSRNKLGLFIQASLEVVGRSGANRRHVDRRGCPVYVVTDYYTVKQTLADRLDPERRTLLSRIQARKDDR